MGDKELTYFVNLGMIGVFCPIGALVAGCYLERIKHTIKITNAMLLAGLIIGVWPNKYCLLASNALQTTSAGIFSVAVPRYMLYQQPLYKRHVASVWVMRAILLGVAVMSLYFFLLNKILSDKDLLVCWVQISLRTCVVVLQTIMLQWYFNKELLVFYYKNYLSHVKTLGK